MTNQPVSDEQRHTAIDLQAFWAKCEARDMAQKITETRNRSIGQITRYTEARFAQLRRQYGIG